MKGSYYGAVKTAETPSTSIYAYPFGSESNQMDSTPQSLNIYNWLNIIGYLTNFIVVGGLGNWFLKDLPDNGAVSEKYQVSFQFSFKLKVGLSLSSSSVMKIHSNFPHCSFLSILNILYRQS